MSSRIKKVYDSNFLVSGYYKLTSLVSVEAVMSSRIKKVYDSNFLVSGYRKVTLIFARTKALHSGKLFLRNFWSLLGV